MKVVTNSNGEPQPHIQILYQAPRFAGWAEEFFKETSQLKREV